MKLTDKILLHINRYKLNSNKIYRNYNNNVDYSKSRVGFFGELGYAIISWFPYLRYVNQVNNRDLKTIGPIGSTPFFESIAVNNDKSIDHVEVDINYSDMWGEESDLVKLCKYNKHYSVITPMNTGVDISINGIKWMNNYIHRYYDSDNNISKLVFPNKYKITEKEYIVINIKNYYNWGNSSIHNYYTKNEIEQIIRKNKDKIIYINVLDRFYEKRNMYFHNDIKDLMKYENVVHTNSIFDGLNAAQVNYKQISLFKGAKHIFATQGGNAALAISCTSNKNITIKMQGGKDYPDYIGMSYLYSNNIDIVYHLDQAKFI